MPPGTAVTARARLGLGRRAGLGVTSRSGAHTVTVGHGPRSDETPSSGWTTHSASANQHDDRRDEWEVRRRRPTSGTLQQVAEMHPGCQGMIDPSGAIRGPREGLGASGLVVPPRVGVDSNVQRP